MAAAFITPAASAPGKEAATALAIGLNTRELEPITAMDAARMTTLSSGI
jgi:hypothetical protein